MMKGETSRRLPRIFWFYWTILFFCVSAEWCVALWSADFLISSLTLSPSQAASLVFVFVGAGAVGRFVGSRLARGQSSRTLLLIYLAILLGGFPLFWLGGTLPLKIIGLAIVGFGAAGLFPLGLASATDALPAYAERISARTSSAIGLAILINPQVSRDERGPLRHRAGVWVGVVARWFGGDSYSSCRQGEALKLVPCG